MRRNSRLQAFQFDWSEDYALIGGERTKLQVAHIKLSHSRAFLIRAYLLLQGQLGRSSTEERRKGQSLDQTLIRKPY
ncbi:hypothetical protein ELH28_30050 (plasmid) [Rhizobium ruizarguesonis]|nr:hypothetical protein ELH28_30050 [Rhizobium ruizarguesonis]